MLRSWRDDATFNKLPRRHGLLVNNETFIPISNELVHTLQPLRLNVSAHPPILFDSALDLPNMS